MTQPNENHSTYNSTTDLQAHSFPKLRPRICLFDQHAVQTDRTGTAYSATELSDLKNCLKFATKLMVRGESLWSEKGTQWYAVFEASIERGIQLIVAKAPIEHVMAGLLSDPFNFIKSKSRATDSSESLLLIQGKIEAKFGSATIKSLESESFARYCKESLSQESDPAAHQSNAAFYMAASLYWGIDRRWGPNETLPLMQHASEVGLLLLAAQYSTQTVAAGFLHDAFENYIKMPKDEILREFNSKLVGYFTPHEVNRIAALIEANTEPAKGHCEENWLVRKSEVFNALHRGDSEMAAVCCASKISTLAAGNKWKYLGQPIQRWSQGTHAQNMVHFQTLARLFEEKGVSTDLIGAFNKQLDLFSKWDEYSPEESLES